LRKEKLLDKLKSVRIDKIQWEIDEIKLDNIFNDLEKKDYEIIK